MKKKIDKLLWSIIILAIINVLIILARIPTDKCGICPTGSYGAYPVIQLIFNYIMPCPARTEFLIACNPARNIIPLDLILLIIILLGIWIYKKKKKA